MRQITIADEIWIATALLQREHPNRSEFTVEEIKEHVRRQALAGGLRAGLDPHIRQHCVANRPPNPARLRILYATGTRTRRLFRPGDPFDPGRARGRAVPAEEDVPAQYRYLLTWYHDEYTATSDGRQQPDPILALRGVGKEIWGGEHPDSYVQRLREGWE